jgi:hypothetical protein
LNFWLLKFDGPPSPLSGEVKIFQFTHFLTLNVSLLATFIVLPWLLLRL